MHARTRTQGTARADLFCVVFCAGAVVCVLLHSTFAQSPKSSTGEENYPASHALGLASDHFLA